MVNSSQGKGVPMHAYELTDEQYERIEDELEDNQGEPGRDLLPHRPILNGILWRLYNGARWEDVPARYGNWKTIYHRFNGWSKDGTWDRIIDKLQSELDEAGEIDWDLFNVDGSNVRAHKHAAGAGKKGGPMSPTTTLWAAAEGVSGPNRTWCATAGACRWRCD